MQQERQLDFHQQHSDITFVMLILVILASQVCIRDWYRCLALPGKKKKPCQQYVGWLFKWWDLKYKLPERINTEDPNIDTDINK